MGDFPPYKICRARKTDRTSFPDRFYIDNVNTVGGNEAKIRKYIRDQEADDQMCDQLSFKEYEDPFKNVADFDDDDSPEVPADSMRK